MINEIAGLAYVALGWAALFLGFDQLVVLAFIGIGAIHSVGNSIVSAIKDSRA